MVSIVSATGWVGDSGGWCSSVHWARPTSVVGGIVGLVVEDEDCEYDFFFWVMSTTEKVMNSKRIIN